MPNETKFTKGPWNSVAILALLECSSDRFIETEEKEANARLIAAAPEMYEAGKETLAALGAFENALTTYSTTVLPPRTVEALAKLRAALAKAEGKA